MSRQRLFIAIEFQDLVGVGLGPAATQLLGDVATFVCPDLLGQLGKQALEFICLVGLCSQCRDDRNHFDYLRERWGDGSCFTGEISPVE